MENGIAVAASTNQIDSGNNQFLSQIAAKFTSGLIRLSWEYAKKYPDFEFVARYEPNSGGNVWFAIYSIHSIQKTLNVPYDGSLPPNSYVALFPGSENTLVVPISRLQAGILYRINEQGELRDPALSKIDVNEQIGHLINYISEAKGIEYLLISCSGENDVVYYELKRADSLKTPEDRLRELLASFSSYQVEVFSKFTAYVESIRNLAKIDASDEIILMMYSYISSGVPITRFAVYDMRFRKKELEAALQRLRDLGVHLEVIHRTRGFEIKDPNLNEEIGVEDVEPKDSSNDSRNQSEVLEDNSQPQEGITSIPVILPPQSQRPDTYPLINTLLDDYRDKQELSMTNQAVISVLSCFQDKGFVTRYEMRQFDFSDAILEKAVGKIRQAGIPCISIHGIGFIVSQKNLSSAPDSEEILYKMRLSILGEWAKQLVFDFAKDQEFIGEVQDYSLARFPVPYEATPLIFGYEYKLYTLSTRGKVAAYLWATSAESELLNLLFKNNGFVTSWIWANGKYNVESQRYLRIATTSLNNKLINLGITNEVGEAIISVERGCSFLRNSWPDFVNMKKSEEGVGSVYTFGKVRVKVWNLGGSCLYSINYGDKEYRFEGVEIATSVMESLVVFGRGTPESLLKYMESILSMTSKVRHRLNDLIVRICSEKTIPVYRLRLEGLERNALNKVVGIMNDIGIAIENNKGWIYTIDEDDKAKNVESLMEYVASEMLKDMDSGLLEYEIYVLDKIRSYVIQRIKISPELIPSPSVIGEENAIYRVLSEEGTNGLFFASPRETRLMEALLRDDFYADKATLAFRDNKAVAQDLSEAALGLESKLQNCGVFRENGDRIIMPDDVGFCILESRRLKLLRRITRGYRDDYRMGGIRIEHLDVKRYLNCNDGRRHFTPVNRRGSISDLFLFEISRKKFTLEIPPNETAFLMAFITSRKQELTSEDLREIILDKMPANIFSMVFKSLFMRLQSEGLIHRSEDVNNYITRGFAKATYRFPITLES